VLQDLPRDVRRQSFLLAVIDPTSLHPPVNTRSRRDPQVSSAVAEYAADAVDISADQGPGSAVELQQLIAAAGEDVAIRQSGHGKNTIGRVACRFFEGKRKAAVTVSGAATGSTDP